MTQSPLLDALRDQQSSGFPSETHTGTLLSIVESTSEKTGDFYDITVDLGEKGILSFGKKEESIAQFQFSVGAQVVFDIVDARQSADKDKARLFVQIKSVTRPRITL